jgi:hypothetical protein
MTVETFSDNDDDGKRLTFFGSLIIVHLPLLDRPRYFEPQPLLRKETAPSVQSRLSKEKKGRKLSLIEKEHSLHRLTAI